MKSFYDAIMKFPAEKYRPLCYNNRPLV
jgi:hypothetical protein